MISQIYEGIFILLLFLQFCGNKIICNDSRNFLKFLFVKIYVTRISRRFKPEFHHLDSYLDLVVHIPFFDLAVLCSETDATSKLQQKLE